MGEKYELLRQGLDAAFIDCNTSSNLAYRPQFVSNDYKEGKKVLSAIEDELLACDEFAISVAFITMGGITPLLQTFKELESKGYGITDWIGIDLKGEYSEARTNFAKGSGKIRVLGAGPGGMECPHMPGTYYLIASETSYQNFTKK